MRFAVADEAAALRDAADALLTARATPAVIRAAWACGTETPADVHAIWRALADVGLPAALVTEQDGGLGLDENCLPPVMERIGYCGLPAPAAETVAVAAPLLAYAGHAALKDVLSGAAVVTAHLRPQPGGGPHSGGGPQRGGAVLVPFGQTADYLLLTARDGLRLYERGELGAESAQAVDGSRQLARVSARTDRGTLLADRGDPAADAAWQRGVLATAAILTGLASRMLSMTVEYVTSRQQFGVPVGSFQAVKHRLADALVAVEFARPAVLAAGWAQAAADPGAAADTSAAKVLASDAALTVARAALQCHGAIGYTTEYDLHLYAKRAWALAPSWGSADWHRHRLAEMLGLGREGPEKEEGEPGG